MPIPPAYLEVAFAIGERLKEARALLQLTQRELSKRLGVSQSYLSEVEGNKSKPNVDLLVGLGIHFPDLNSHWILTGMGKMQGPDRLYPVDNQLDILATSASLKALREWEKTVPEGFAWDREAFAVALYYKTYMNHYDALVASGKGEREARSLAYAECMGLDRGEISKAVSE